MKRTLALSALLALFLIQGALANPRPCYEIQELSAFPPRLGIFFCDSLDISGDTIYTTAGYAVVNPGVIGGPDYGSYEYFYLDSSNTSGFVINPERDSISISFIMDNPVGLGNYGSGASPIKGHHIEYKTYSVPPWYYYWVFCFEFANPDQGRTNVIINEVNSHTSWGPGRNFIELYNKGNEEVSLAGWKIVCDTILDLPSDARIQPFEHYVIEESSFPPGFDMDFAADNLYLIDADSDIVDQVGWSSDHGEDVSFGRYPDGNVDSTAYMWDFWGYNDLTSTTFFDGYPTRHAFNRDASPGLRIIGTYAEVSDNLATIRWTNPVWLSVFDMAILRKDTISFPRTPFDGEIVYEGTGQEATDTVAPGQRTYYSVFARTSCGDYSEPDSESQVMIFLPEVGIDDEPLPEAILLFASYPNPFNPATTMIYGLANAARVNLSIYNVAGQRVAVLVEGAQQAGEHKIVWDGARIPSGVYFARLESGNESRSLKLVLVK